MTLPNENPKLKSWVSSSVEFRNKCSQHELSTARVKIGQLLVSAESSPYAPSQPPRVECQTLPSGLESGRQAQPPSLGAYLPPGGCSQLDGSARFPADVGLPATGARLGLAPPTFTVMPPLLPTTPGPGPRKAWPASQLGPWGVDRWWGLGRAYLHILSAGKEINTAVTWFSGWT